MKVTTLEEVIESLLKKKQFLYEDFGVTRMGVFGSFTQGTQKDTSDIDIIESGTAIQEYVQGYSLQDFPMIEKRILQSSESLKL